MSIYYVPPINLLGKGCLNEAKDSIKSLGTEKAFIVSDKFLVSNGTVKKVTDILSQIDVDFVVYDEVKQNPTVTNVNKGLKILKSENCDFVITIGGGSPQDCGKAISILATNGGDIRDYEGINKTSKKCLPIIAITTTAGTSAEVTINYVITDEDRHVKMIMVDTNSLATMTVNDPELMISKPSNLTAATGMDALTHAIEAVVANGAYDVTDSTALYAIKQIFKYLPRAVKNGNDIEAREQMCYACFLNGIAFSNAGLGNVHAMAHQLGGLYDLPHGVCNAMLLPIVEEENAKSAPAKFRPIAEVIGMDVNNKSDKECVDFVIDKIKALSEEVGIPKSLKDVGVDNPNFELLAENSMKDACAGANPVFFDKDKIIELFMKIS
ncbi:iron-containing alcohol dehydrogenase [Clostridioides difficile]|uniref:iron-containing alcohol dehydrogenase n=1 Tax=Clostridioides difficile TaxID=1496 RepID=UPI00188BD275|nr:iron-containing alcohol dehydrogenase [Clostridioides difficile]EJA6628341.1 iron-containing alcohol dehydrogenase [Clostridioides difficile]MBF4775951.1 iron-containing alcohol dehydrogenase [Clostridioides difficile]MBZ0749716.1 iron-containing alcohol dehydrogenase [Clostridioides difficile]MDV9385778.1 iron-containing alcohol dehydrogenase [Clostridioides difficile]HBG2501333.1 iron-containing alcohol dehydrogenase [Clostridioides difficile]